MLPILKRHLIAIRLGSPANRGTGNDKMNQSPLISINQKMNTACILKNRYDMAIFFGFEQMKGVISFARTNDVMKLQFL